jgi:hypothetical protein
VSSAYSTIGLLSLTVGAMAIAQGMWMAITARKPSWLSSRYVPIGRERGLGIALITAGLGCALQGASDIEIVAFASLRLLGVGVFLLGVVFVFVAFRLRNSQ